MHRYLRSIGFADNINSEYDIELILNDLFRTYDRRETLQLDGEKRILVQLFKSFGPNIGLSLCGELDMNGFHRMFYFPYLTGTSVSSGNALESVELKSSGGGYLAMCDDPRLGVSLIYFVTNPLEYKKAAEEENVYYPHETSTLSGLALSGVILLPVEKDSGTVKSRNTFNAHHNMLVSQARYGDEDAIENLAMEDMSTYDMITRRLPNEDILTIVDSYFMPHGAESDQYQVLGTIQTVTRVCNSHTQEYVYQMTLDCNDVIFDICINERDLYGEPEVGRRFKGNIWLQGRIHFSTN